MSSLMDNLLTDEVIKRRLLVDGDGVGDDRRILGLMRTHVEFCIKAKDMSPETRAAEYRKVLNNLHQVAMSFVRTNEMIKVNEGTRDMFVELGNSLRSEVEQTKGHIIQYKALLEDATKHRKHAMEYDALAKLIHSQPDRKGTEAKKDKLSNELYILKTKEANLTHKLVARRQNITTLSASIEQLKTLLLNEDTFFTLPSLDSEEGKIRYAVDNLVNPSSDDHWTLDVDDSTTNTSSSQLSSSQDTVVAAPIPMEVDPPVVTTKTEKGGGKKSVKNKSADNKLHEELSESDGEQQ